MQVQNHGAWLAGRADVGCWVALEGDRIIAHVYPALWDLLCRQK